MKKIYFLLAFVCSSFLLNAQVTLEKSISLNSSENGYIRFEKLKLKSEAEKFVLKEDCENVIYIYNTDYSIYKTINVPVLSNLKYWDNILYVSDNLFNTDDKIEYVCFGLTDNEEKEIFRVYNEDGTLLLNADLCTFPNVFNRFSDEEGEIQFIFNTDVGTKMVLYNHTTKKLDFYSLPGKLPCDLCDGKVVGVKSMAELTKSLLSQPYPNPSKGYTQLDYQLPEGVVEGIIVLYDLNGNVIRSYNVDRGSTSLKIKTSDLRAGTYFYSLKTSAGLSQGQKMVVVK